jgi:hypothetical protein
MMDSRPLDAGGTGKQPLYRKVGFYPLFYMASAEADPGSDASASDKFPRIGTLRPHTSITREQSTSLSEGSCGSET